MNEGQHKPQGRKRALARIHPQNEKGKEKSLGCLKPIFKEIHLLQRGVTGPTTSFSAESGRRIGRKRKPGRAHSGRGPEVFSQPRVDQSGR